MTTLDDTITDFAPLIPARVTKQYERQLVYLSLQVDEEDNKKGTECRT